MMSLLEVLYSISKGQQMLPVSSRRRQTWLLPVDPWEHHAKCTHQSVVYPTKTTKSHRTSPTPQGNDRMLSALFCSSWTK